MDVKNSPLIKSCQLIAGHCFFDKLIAMNFRDYAIRAGKKGYRFFSGQKFLNPACEIDRQVANDHIFDLLAGSSPVMISRFGTTELNCINNYLCVNSDKPFAGRLVDYITGHTHTPWWNSDHFQVMSDYSGIFPPTQSTAERFSEIYLQDSPEIDLLGSFQYFEKYMPLKPDVVRVQLETLYPFFVDRPWTRILTGKKVLVIHPFSKTIEEQYGRRNSLFERPDILPDFKLSTLKAVQSVGGTQTEFRDWFEALESMKRSVNSIDFDIAIIGCGAYGLPLAAHIKRIGKKSVHLGGGTQLLFGIKGKRWEEQYSRTWEYRPGEVININYVDIFNENWVYPAAEEKPGSASKVENACYW